MNDRNPHRQQGKPHPRTLLVGATLLTMTIGAVLSLTSCEEPPPTSSQGRRETEAGLDYIDIAMEYLDRLDQFDPEAVRDRVVYNLNRWREDEPPDDQWTEDPLVSRIATKYRDGFKRLQYLDDREFEKDDGLFLQEVYWMKQVSDWVSRPNRDAGFGAWIADAESSLNETERNAFRTKSDRLAAALQVFHPSLSKEDVTKLAVSVRLFDWTIRNVQLDETLPPTEDEDGVPAPIRAIPGPGYQHYPWQTMMYGHGDAVERARVFMMLARQQRIDTVMLAFDEGTRTSRPEPWAAAVLLGGQLYLFDAELGLPIPAAGGRGIATLEEVVSDPQVVRALDIAADDGDGVEIAYHVSSDDLTKVVALIDAEAPSLSHRMDLLERRLTGDRRLVLRVQPARLAEKVLPLKGITQVSIWTMPFETYLYRFALVNKVAADAELQRAFFKEEGAFRLLTPIMRARQSYFEGVLDPQPDEDNPGAKALYLQSRVPDEVLDSLEDSAEVQQQLGFGDGKNQDPEKRRQMLRDYREVFEAMRSDAAYWLAITHYERGDYSSAVNWLERLRTEVRNTTWMDGARYNLARAYEVMGDHQKARGLYMLGDSPQRHGNLLRARMLLEESPAGTSVAETNENLPCRRVSIRGLTAFAPGHPKSWH